MSFHRSSIIPFRSLNNKEKLKKIGNEGAQMAKRLPKACVKSISTSAKSFFKGAKFLVPFSLVMNLKNFNPWQLWLLQGVRQGCGLATFGAYYAVDTS